MALASALDVREHNTGVHSQRVADYMLRLARETGVREKDALTKIKEKSDTHFDPAVMAAFAKIPFEDLRDIAKKNETPLLFASPPVPSLYQVTSTLSPRS